MFQQAGLDKFKVRGYICRAERQNVTMTLGYSGFYVCYFLGMLQIYEDLIQQTYKQLLNGQLQNLLLLAKPVTRSFNRLDERSYSC